MWLVHVLILASRHFFRELAIATQNHDDDVFAHQLCADATIRAGLGRYSVCKEAGINVQFSPWQIALFHVGERLLHCGEETCFEVAARGVFKLTETLYGLLLVLGGLILASVVTVVVFGGKEVVVGLPQWRRLRLHQE